MVWNIKPTHIIKAVAQPPILVHNDNQPMNQPMTRKNKEMIMNGNMNREVRK